jgi:hypothetical protein
MSAAPTRSTFIRGLFVTAPTGDLAYPKRDSQLRDSAGFKPNFAAVTAASFSMQERVSPTPRFLRQSPVWQQRKRVLTG